MNPGLPKKTPPMISIWGYGPLVSSVDCRCCFFLDIINPSKLVGLCSFYTLRLPWTHCVLDWRCSFALCGQQCRVFAPANSLLSQKRFWNHRQWWWLADHCYIVLWEKKWSISFFSCNCKFSVYKYSMTSVRNIKSCKHSSLNNSEFSSFLMKLSDQSYLQTDVICFSYITL